MCFSVVCPFINAIYIISDCHRPNKRYVYPLKVDVFIMVAFSVEAVML